ncbi:hypothetical protein QFZ20_002214 [Flavobacterium sp. W4I14]|nr:hypothetical protein [Flavobacterium sp. W4I14]
MKKHIILVFFVLIFYKTFSQQTPQIVPPSPVTHEFEKYINYEVSMYNGLPDITIPLYSISLKGMEIPINLTYHASGIKYRQESGEVGVGWTLNPGYRVSRTVYGFPDEKSAKPSNAMDSISFYNPDPMKRDKYLTRFMDPDMPEVPVNYGIALTDRLDGEYDIFNYSLPVESGAFAISDRSTKAIQTFEKSNIALNYSTGLSNNGQLNGILGFDIRDTKGNRYLFGEHTVSDLNAIESTSKYGAFLGNAWGITDVITSYGDLLKFKYSAGNVGGWTTNNSSVTIFSANPSYVESTSAIDYSYGSSDAYKAFFVQEISSNKEKIQFARQSGYNLVSRLSVFDASNGLIKAVNFFYSNNGYHNFLDSIQITDKNLTAVQTYKFKYNFKDYSGSVMADQWGYYRPGDAQHRFHREFADDVIYQRDATGAGYNTATNFLADFGDRSAAGTDLFALNSITYPAGGSTEYIYGVHKSYDIHTQQYKTGRWIENCKNC